MILAQKIRLDPNNKQATFFERCAGASRFVFNWGLARWQELYESGEKPSWLGLNKELNSVKQGRFPWLTELPWAVANLALRDLGNAFSHFFRRVKKGGKPGYPRFKSKKRTKPAFGIEGRALKFDGKRVRIPKLGWVRTRQRLRFPGKILTARFSKHAGRWYLSVQVEVDDTKWTYPHRCETQTEVGIDLGVKDLAVLSTGEKIPAPRTLRKYELRLRRLDKELSRRKKGGRNWQKTKAKLARLHERIANIRKDFTHNLTAGLVRRFKLIAVEDLSIKGMSQNRRLAKSVMDAAMSEVVRQLEYKTELSGSSLVKIDRWFPSSKTCHVCGFANDNLKLSDKVWSCPSCGTVLDRDINAALNILAVAHTVTACCQDSSGASVGNVKLSRGQESSSYVKFV